jgi:hypothetical protein
MILQGMERDGKIRMKRHARPRKDTAYTYETEIKYKERQQDPTKANIKEQRTKLKTKIKERRPKLKTNFKESRPKLTTNTTTKTKE